MPEYNMGLVDYDSDSGSEEEVISKNVEEEKKEEVIDDVSVPSKVDASSSSGVSTAAIVDDTMAITSKSARSKANALFKKKLAQHSGIATTSAASSGSSSNSSSVLGKHARTGDLDDVSGTTMSIPTPQPSLPLSETTLGNAAFKIPSGGPVNFPPFAPLGMTPGVFPYPQYPSGGAGVAYPYGSSSVAPNAAGSQASYVPNVYAQMDNRTRREFGFTDGAEAQAIIANAVSVDSAAISSEWDPSAAIKSVNSRNQTNINVRGKVWNSSAGEAVSIGEASRSMKSKHQINAVAAAALAARARQNNSY